MKQINISSGKRMIAYAKLSVPWSSIEVLMYCYAEFPPVFTYKGSALVDPDSGYWIVRYAELVAKMVAFVLFWGVRQLPDLEVTTSIDRVHASIVVKASAGERRKRQ